MSDDSIIHFYKNQLYKNNESQKDLKIKNNMRKIQLSLTTKKLEEIKNKRGKFLRNTEPQQQLIGSYKKVYYHKGNFCDLYNNSHILTRNTQFKSLTRTF